MELGVGDNLPCFKALVLSFSSLLAAESKGGLRGMGCCKLTEKKDKWQPLVEGKVEWLLVLISWLYVLSCSHFFFHFFCFSFGWPNMMERGGGNAGF